VYDGANTNLYVNTVAGTVGILTGTCTKLADLYISQASNDFAGYIDELRISDTARSANWISTTFETQDDPDAFMSWGGEQNVPTNPFISKHLICPDIIKKAKIR
ncbi:unnamed protein product, partial [marine sediment metagenome]